MPNPWVKRIFLKPRKFLTKWVWVWSKSSELSPLWIAHSYSRLVNDFCYILYTYIYTYTCYNNAISVNSLSIHIQISVIYKLDSIVIPCRLFIYEQQSILIVRNVSLYTLINHHIFTKTLLSQSNIRWYGLLIYKTHSIVTKP